MVDLRLNEPPLERTAFSGRHPDDVRRMARQTRRRRSFAAIMMALLGLSSIGLAATFFYSAGTGQQHAPRQQVATENKVAVSKKAIKMMAPKVTGFDRKERAYQINAEVARQDQDEPHIVHMEKIVASMKLTKSNDVIQVTADLGTYDNNTETLKLSGNIILISASGYTARLERADVWMKQGRIATDRPLTITAPEGAIAANAMEMSDDGDNIRFFNRAKMLFRGEKKEKG